MTRLLSRDSLVVLSSIGMPWALDVAASKPFDILVSRRSEGGDHDGVMRDAETIRGGISPARFIFLAFSRGF